MDPAPLPSAQRACLLALLDRLIPEDDFPGALAAGTDGYVLRQLAGDCAGEAPALRAGLEALEAAAASRHGAGAIFAGLPPAARDALLGELWAGGPPPWLARFAELAAEGFYADPGNGGNRDAVSWKMIRYEPGRPAGLDRR